MSERDDVFAWAKIFLKFRTMPTTVQTELVEGPAPMRPGSRRFSA